MKISSVSEHYSLEKITHILCRVPVFYWIHQYSEQQLKALVPFCRLLRIKPGETIIRKGDKTEVFYFLIKGGCFVYIDENDRCPINHIRPNELFGEVSSLLKKTRTAFVVANYDAPETIALEVDSKIFFPDTIDGMEAESKALMYRMIQRTIYQRLQKANYMLEGLDLEYDMPSMERPASYLSSEEQLYVYFQDSVKGALVLRKVSETIGALLNQDTSLIKALQKD